MYDKKIILEHKDKTKIELYLYKINNYLYNIKVMSYHADGYYSPVGSFETETNLDDISRQLAMANNAGTKISQVIGKKTIPYKIMTI